MSKAEDLAMKHCCAKCVHDKFGCSMKVLHNGRDCIKCGNYIKGYEQAEKDLELTWEDMAFIRLAFDAIEANIHLGAIKIQPMTKEYYQEILKRFKDFKERKQR